MRVGYYFANSARFGNYWGEVKGLVNTFMDYERGVTPLPTLSPGHKIWFDLFIKEGAPYNSPEYIKRTLQSLRPVWGKVLAVQLSDEPTWERSQTNAWARSVKRIIANLGLPARPVGITLTAPRIMTSRVWEAENLDYVGVEGYIDYKKEPLSATKKRVQDQFDKQLARIAPAGKKVMIIGQAFDRNGHWPSEEITDVDSLVAIQEAAFRTAKRLGTKCLMLALFAYGYKSGSPVAEFRGVKAYPELFKEHQRLLKLYT